jgi:hypothetical protein
VEEGGAGQGSSSRDGRRLGTEGEGVGVEQGGRYIQGEYCIEGEIEIEGRQFYWDTVCPPVDKTATQLTVRYGTYVHSILDRAIQITQYLLYAYLHCYFLLPCTFFDILNIHRNIDLKLYVLPC